MKCVSVLPENIISVGRLYFEKSSNMLLVVSLLYSFLSPILAMNWFAKNRMHWVHEEPVGFASRADSFEPSLQCEIVSSSACVEL